jgi:RHS repeat-associated protein
MPNCFGKKVTANSTTNNGSANPLTSFVNGLTAAFGTSNQVSSLLKNNASTVTTQLSGNSEFTTMINPAASTSGTDQAPKAYLNVLFFNEQFQFDAASSVVVKVAYGLSKQTIDRMFSNALTAGKSGYVYVYFSNESETQVYFDNFMLTHERSSLTEETHYYPFGLTMAGISSKALGFGNPSNKKKFNGKEEQRQEFSDGSGLELYDFHARNYDAQIGRWHNIDPLADQTPSVSPFVFVMNNPIMLIDPDGRTISGDTAMVSKLESAAGNIKKSEEATQARLQKRIDKRDAKGKNTDRLQGKMADSKARLNEVNGLLSDIGTLRSSTQDYYINSNYTPPVGSGISGETNYNPTTGSIDVNISASYGLAGLAHELTHAYQYDQGLTDFNRNGVDRGYLHDITDEQAAYRRQFAINGGLGGINHMWQITDNWVRGLNAQYQTLPAFDVNRTTSLHIMFMMHRMVNPAVTYYPSVSDAIKSYRDAKTTIFSNYISR